MYPKQGNYYYTSHVQNDTSPWQRKVGWCRFYNKLRKVKRKKWKNVHFVPFDEEIDKEYILNSVILWNIFVQDKPNAAV